MEAQRIVVNGRNLPVHRWIELNEEAAAAQEQYSQPMPYMQRTDPDCQMNMNPQDATMLALSKKSTDADSGSGDSSNSPAKKNFFNSQDRVGKFAKRSRQQFKNNNSLNQLKQRYKTELCRHYKRSGYCPLEAYCQFAHGNHELRRPTDPLPGSFGESQLGAVHSNYKTSACRNYVKTGHCKFGNTCSFYHDPSERRKLTDPLPNMPQGINVPPQTNKVYIENQKDMQANWSFDHGAFNSFSQQMGYGHQKLNELDEIAATGGFNPDKYMAPMPQPMNADQPMPMPQLPTKTE